MAAVTGHSTIQMLKMYDHPQAIALAQISAKASYLYMNPIRILRKIQHFLESTWAVIDPTELCSQLSVQTY